MTANPFYSGRIPQELFNRVENFRKESGEQKTELLINALAQYIGFELRKNEPQTPPIRAEFDSIYARLEKLESLLISDNKEITKDNNKNQMEIKYDNKTITDDNNLNKTTDKEKTTSENKSENINDTLLITQNNKYQLLLTKEVEKVTGASQSALSIWKKEGKFPKLYKNKKTGKKFEISFDEGRSAKRKQMWRVRSIDNN